MKNLLKKLFGGNDKPEEGTTEPETGNGMETPSEGESTEEGTM